MPVFATLALAFFGFATLEKFGQSTAGGDIQIDARHSNESRVCAFCQSRSRIILGTNRRRAPEYEPENFKGHVFPNRQGIDDLRLRIPLKQ